MGIWSALAAIYPTSAEQRCWNHKLRNVLDGIPLKRHDEVKLQLQAIANAATRASCERRVADFRRAYGRAFPKAVERLEQDWERMITYDAFPAPHWRHLRTTNVIESPFHTVRLRTSAAKRFKKVENATALIWKLLLVAEHQFRKLNAPHLCHEVYTDTRYRDGVRVVPASTRASRAA